MGIDKKLSVDDKQIYYVNSQTPEIYRRHLFSSTFTGAPAKEISVFLTPVTEANCPWVADRPLQMPGATQYFLRAEKHHPRSEKKKKKEKEARKRPPGWGHPARGFPPAQDTGSLALGTPRGHRSPPAPPSTATAGLALPAGGLRGRESSGAPR